MINVLEDGICSSKTSSKYKRCFVVSREESNGISAYKIKREVLSYDHSILRCQHVLTISNRQFPINLSKRNAFVEM